MAIIGIDLGTTNSLACIWKDGRSVLIPNSHGEFLTPSVVSLCENDTITVGKTAKERLITHPHNTAASFKRSMGTAKKYELGDKSFTAPELSSFVLRTLRDDAQSWLGEEVTEAIISVPAYFNDAQRSSTKLAASLAGLNVERLINEPSAAALLCRSQNTFDNGCFLVFDFGGGTLDVSVVECFENIVEIVSIAGSNSLGGDDFDMIIAKHFCNENNIAYSSLSQNEQAILLSSAARCKCALSSNEQSNMVLKQSDWQGSLLMTNELLAQLSAGLLLQIQGVVARALRDCGRRRQDIEAVVLVGGSCKMPLIGDFVSQLLRKPIVSLLSPDTTVALGVGVYAGIKARNSDIRDMLLMDVCPFTLGVNVINHADETKPLMSPIIDRNSTLPISKTSRYVTIVDRQKKMTFDIYQGEELYAKDNLLLGSVTIDIPPARAGEEGAEIRFTYDINGMLDVDVTNATTKKTVNKEFIRSGNNMSDAEIEQKRQEIRQLKSSALETEEADYLIARAERLYSESFGTDREVIRYHIDCFGHALSEGRKVAIIKEMQDLHQVLDDYEERLFAFGDDDLKGLN